MKALIRILLQSSSFCHPLAVYIMETVQLKQQEEDFIWDNLMTKYSIFFDAIHLGPMTHEAGNVCTVLGARI